MRAHAEAGFTLLETLVALAVFGLAALALVKLAGENVRTEAIVETRTFASVVAENQAVEALTSFSPPPLGDEKGTEEAAGRHWHWTRHVREADSNLLRIDVTVAAPDSKQIVGEISVFRVRP